MCQEYINLIINAMWMNNSVLKLLQQQGQATDFRNICTTDIYMSLFLLPATECQKTKEFFHQQHKLISSQEDLKNVTSFHPQFIAVVVQYFQNQYSKPQLFFFLLEKCMLPTFSSINIIELPS